MNDISFKGLYRLQTVSNKNNEHERLEKDLKKEFNDKKIDAAIVAGSRSIEKDTYLIDTLIVSYGTPEEDYEVLQNIFGKKLIQPWILDIAKSRFTSDFMNTFKQKVSAFVDKKMKDLDTEIEDPTKREEIKKSLLETQEKANLCIPEFRQNALDIG